mgnify:CR=1 FL=1
METEALHFALFIGALIFCSTLFMFVSTPIHELMHLCAAKLCGVVVTEVKLLQFSLVRMGYIVVDKKSFKKKSHVYFVHFAGGIGSGVVFLISLVVCFYFFRNVQDPILNELYSAILFALGIIVASEVVGGVIEGVFESNKVIRALSLEN